MKKIAFAAALCASFSSVHAQTANTITLPIASGATPVGNGSGGMSTSAVIVPLATTVVINMITNRYMAVQNITLNGTSLLGNGFVDPNLSTKLKNANCRYTAGTDMTNHSAVCTKTVN